MEIEEGATAASLCLRLAADFPKLEDHFHTLMVAVNSQHADWEFILSEGDEISFLSTMAGGTV